MRRVLILGAGGQGRIVADILLAARAAGGEAAPVGFVDDRLDSSPSPALPLLGRTSDLAAIAHDAVVVAIGDNAARKGLCERLVAAGEPLATAVHPFSSIASDVEIGPGTMVSAGAILLPGARIGRGVLVNTRASIDHDSVVGDFAHVSAGATVGARVRIGEETLVAIGATVVSGRTVGARTVVGAGAVVVRDLPADCVAWGVPARVTSGRRSRDASR